MTVQHENKILVSLVWIKWISGLSATLIGGCFIFLWNMNAFRATTNTTITQHTEQIGILQMSVNKINENEKETYLDIQHLKDTKEDKQQP